jgi:hypothetical protein
MTFPATVEETAPVSRRDVHELLMDNQYTTQPSRSGCVGDPERQSASAPPHLQFGEATARRT